MSGALPNGACDAHCHIFGPAGRFPYAATRSYTPGDALAAALRALHATLGLDRAILVQPACYGYDPSAMLDGIAMSQGAWRGVALLRPGVTKDEMAVLDQRGVIGVRFNFMPHLGPAPDPSEVRRVAALAATFGWHLCLHLRAGDLPELRELLSDLPTPFVIDHLARLQVDQPDTEADLIELQRTLDLRNSWCKISGADRASHAGAPFDDVVPVLRRLLNAHADRLLWGTDWPHPNVVGATPDDVGLLDLLLRVADGTAMVARILVDNPDALYSYAWPAVRR